MKIPKAIHDEMPEHARAEVPNECCGLVGGKDGAAVTYYPATNAEASPFRYSIEPKELFEIPERIEREGLELAAIFHSHTKSEAYPSQTDINLAFLGGDVGSGDLSYPSAIYLIASLAPGQEPLRGFRFLPGGKVEEVELQVE
jgi:proteasome lid subunit RPN8/RPN11